jgi:hypothetical protein
MAVPPGGADVDGLGERASWIAARDARFSAKGREAAASLKMNVCGETADVKREVSVE